MTLAFTNSDLSEMPPLEIFDYYEGPRFYSVRDAVGQLFLVYWIDESETSSSWLYVPVSSERYGALKRGYISVAEALSNPETGVAFVGRKKQLRQISLSEIDTEWLPSEDYRLDKPHSILPVKEISAVELSTKVHRQVFDIAFTRPSNTHELAARSLGRMLEAIQATVDALACADNTSIKRVSEEIRNESELMFTTVFESSFGVRLQSRGSDLFANSRTAMALELLSHLFGALAQPEEITGILHKFNILSRSRFKHLLSVMVDSQVSLSADWGNIDGRTIQSRASFENISQSFERLNAASGATKQEVSHRGRLVGVDIRSNFFAFVDESDRVIKGELSPDLRAQHFEIPSEVIATVEEKLEVDPLTDRERWTYVLLKTAPPR